MYKNSKAISNNTKCFCNLNKQFIKLTMLDKLSQASKLINRTNRGLLSLNQETTDQLVKKLSKVNPANLNIMLTRPALKVEVIFESTDANFVSKAVKLINGSGKPSLIAMQIEGSI